MNKPTGICAHGTWLAYSNIGNAFMNLGSEWLMRRLLPDWQHVRVAFGGHFLKRVFLEEAPPEWDQSPVVLPLEEVRADLLVLSGIVLWGGLAVANHNPGLQVLYNGVGLHTYHQHEVTSHIKSMPVPPLAFMARDRRTVRVFRLAGWNAISGVDAACFVPEACPDLPTWRGERLQVMCFDYSEPPADLPVQGRRIVVTHSCGPQWTRNPYRLGLPVLVGDEPMIYLSAYRHCRVTYSDRVHGCLAALLYGNDAQLFSRTPRAAVLANLGINLTQLRMQPCRLNMDYLHQRKQQHINDLRAALESAGITCAPVEILPCPV